MGIRRVFAALIAAVLLFSGALAEGKWSVAPTEEKAEAAFDGAYYTAKGRLSAEIEDANGMAVASAPQSFEFELSAREAADGWEAELMLDTFQADTGEEPWLSDRMELSLSIGSAGGNCLVKDTTFDRGTPTSEQRYSATLDKDYRLTVRDELSGNVILDSGAVELFLGIPAEAKNLAAWAEALPLLKESARIAVLPLYSKLEGFLFENADSAVVHMRELALPVVQLFNDPRVESALKMTGLELPTSAMYDVLELLGMAKGVFELRRLENGDVSVTYLSEGSPETSRFKVDAILRQTGLDFKVLNNTYNGLYDTVSAGEIDFSDGVHFAVEDYGFGAFLYLDATPGEMSPSRQVLDARAAYKLEPYDDPELLLLHFENAVDDMAGTARTDATLRFVDAGSTATVTLEIDHTFKE